MSSIYTNTPCIQLFWLSLAQNKLPALNVVFTYDWCPVNVGSLAVEVHFNGLCPGHVAEAKVNGVSGQTNCRKIQTGLERDRLHTGREKNLTDAELSGYFFTTYFRFPASNLQAVVAVANQEVLLEPQSPLTSLRLNQHHIGRNFLFRLVCIIQKGRSAAERHFYLFVTENRGAIRHQRLLARDLPFYPADCLIKNWKMKMKIKQCERDHFLQDIPSRTMTTPPHLTNMRCCGCSNKYWLSSLCGLLEFRVLARGRGLRTINGGWVSSLKCNGNSKLFLSSKVWMTSKSRNTVCRATQPETRCKDNAQPDCTEAMQLPLICAQLMRLADFSCIPSSLVPLSVNRRLRHETPAPARHRPSAHTACSNRKPRGFFRPFSDSPNSNFKTLTDVLHLGARNCLAVAAYTAGLTAASRSTLIGSRSKPWVRSTFPGTQAIVCKATQHNIECIVFGNEKKNLRCDWANLWFISFY